MITNEQIKKIIDKCKNKGYDISVRDISFVILCNQFDDSLIAYKCLFGNDKDYNQDYLVAYERTSAITFLKTYIDMISEEGKKKGKKKYKDVTFDENKEEIIKLIEDTQQAFKNGEIKASDALKIQADLRVKLNDKFNVQEEVKEQMVVVNAKYNDICSYCGHEISRRPISKEEAMEMYNLVEKDK